MASSEKNKAVARRQARAEASPFASHRNAKISARKAQLVAGEIRGKSVEQAMLSLAFSKKKSSGLFAKVLEAAVANADERGFDIDTLKVAAVTVDKGPITRRFMPRAQGRATRIRKQSAHLTITLDALQPE